MAANRPIARSPTPSARADSQSFSSQSSSGAEYSFHADPTQELESSGSTSSSADKFAHTRTKRKRTSPEDFAILEAEYQVNPRPDKTSRWAIGKRVTLSEKELQIWFQNRRQMTRRKCRTWQPNAITSIIRSTQDDTPAGTSVAADGGSSVAQQSQEPMKRSASQDSISFGPPSLDISQQKSEEDMKTASEITSTARTAMEAIQSIEGVDETDDSGEVDASFDASQATTVGNGSVEEEEILKVVAPAATEEVDSVQAENIHKVPEEDRDTQALDEPQTAKSEVLKSELTNRVPAVELAPVFKKKSTTMRLSLSLDGKAEIIMSGGTPSPPKKPQAPSISFRSGSLQRSQSMISPSSQPTSSLAEASLPAWNKSRYHGRSRDARTWEFYCDSESRNALTKTAEQDQKGSALGVIGLIRSMSGSRKPLTPVKRENSQLHRSSSGSKRKALGEHGMGKPKLARTASSVARLQTTAHSRDKNTKEAYSKPGSRLALWSEPSGDSDKENNDPDKEASECRERPVLATSHRGILQENTTVMSHASSLDAMMQNDNILAKQQRQKQAGPQDQENRAEKSDDEVAAFMGEKLPEAGDEMSAVQNLLSLSQGAWR